MCSGTAGGSTSFEPSDFRNHDDVLVERAGELSALSFALWMIPDVFLPNMRLVLLLLGRSGSIASVKNSCSSACLDVGLTLGSHIKHQVTNCARLAGHIGAGKWVSKE